MLRLAQQSGSPALRAAVLDRVETPQPGLAPRRVRSPVGLMFPLFSAFLRS